MNSIVRRRYVKLQELSRVWMIARSLLLWNNLSVLRDSEHTFLEFRRLLKMHRFAEDSGAWWLFALWSPYKYEFALHYITCLLTYVELTLSVSNAGKR